MEYYNKKLAHYLQLKEKAKLVGDTKLEAAAEIECENYRKMIKQLEGEK